MNTPSVLLPRFAEPAGETASPGSLALGSLIACQPFFKGMDASQFQLLADSALVLNFEKDQTILEEGESANRFYLILEGTVALESHLDAHGAVLQIQTLGPGDAVGWSWLFPPYAIHLGARALGPVKTIFFYGTRLREQCEQDHEFGYQLMTRVAEVATQCLQATQQRMGACMDIDKLSRMDLPPVTLPPSPA